MDMFLNGLHDSSGQPLKAYKVYFWTNSGASTEKTVWSDIDKTAVIDQSSGVTLGNKGELDVYGDGEYYVQVKTPAGVLHDSFTISYSSTVDFGGLYIDVGADFGTTGTKIQEALDSLNSSVNYTLLFKGAEFVIGQNITFPSNVLIKGMITATINQTSGTLTINRTPELPEFQFFTGTPSITWGSAVQHVKPIWTEGDATSDAITIYGNSTINGNSIINGSNTYKVVSKTATYTAANESVILVDASSGAVTINLPAASGLSGREYTIKKTDSSTNTITINGNASETIDGETTRIIYSQYASLTVICDGSNWLVVKSLDETKDIIVTNATPGLTLRDNNGGSNEEQRIYFESADGQYAQIEGATTGTGVGELNLYTDSGSGLTERLRVDHRGLDIFGNIMNLGIGNSPFASTYKFDGVNDTWYTIGTDNSLRFAGHIYVSNSTNSSSRRAAKIYRIFANNYFPFYQITQVENFGTSTHIELAFNSNQLQVRNRSGATEELYVTFILGGIESGLVNQ